MKRASVASGSLIALFAATLAIADTGPPAEPPRPQQPNQATPPSDQSSERSQAETQKLVNACIAQVQVSNPMVPVKDIKDFCDREAKKTSPKD